MIDKKCFFPITALSTLFIIAAQPHPVPGAETGTVEIDINRLKKEISQVKTERQRLHEDLSRDKSEFASYQERTASRKLSYAAETDSLHKLIVSFERKKDSLDAHISSIELEKRNFDLLKERFREHIAKACEQLLSSVKKCPPVVSRPIVGAITFLLNDCTTKNIDNIEALQRLVQTVRNVDEATLSIQTGQEASPVPDIRGSASMLRIGAVFEAIVDEDGKNAAVWLGGPGWRTLSGEENVGTISKAIAIRESKALPAFIALPWGIVRPKESDK